MGACRSEGAAEERLALVASADAMQFVGTRRLEEEMGGKDGHSWRNILLGGFRSTPLLLLEVDIVAQSPFLRLPREAPPPSSPLLGNCGVLLL